MFWPDPPPPGTVSDPFTRVVDPSRERLGLWMDEPVKKKSWTRHGLSKAKRRTLRKGDVSWEKFLGEAFATGTIGKRRLPFPGSALEVNWAKVAGIGAGVYFGLTALRNIYRSSDDDYNTIEGLSHQGLAGYYRKQNTNFGSGYTGLGVGLAIGYQSSRPKFGSPFEKEVYEGLEAKGWDVESQLDVQDFSVDVGIKDPTTGNYLAGVEADGLSYHRGNQKKKLDKWRQRIIEEDTERQIYRIGSNRWRQNPAEEIARVDLQLRRDRQRLPWIQEGYNSFDGLWHRGLAPLMRLRNTDFGSMWQGIKRGFQTLFGGGLFERGGLAIERGLAKRGIGETGRAYKRFLEDYPSIIESIQKSKAILEQERAYLPALNKIEEFRKKEILGNNFSKEMEKFKENFFFHGTPSTEEVVTTGRLIPGRSNDMHQIGEVGVYVTPEYKVGKGYAINNRYTNKKPGIFIIPKSEIFKPTVSPKEFITTNQSVSFEKAVEIFKESPRSLDFYQEWLRTVKSLPYFVLGKKNIASFSQEIQQHEFGISQALKDLTNKTLGIRKTLIKSKPYRYESWLDEGKFERPWYPDLSLSRVESFTVYKLEGIKTHPYNPLHIARPTKIAEQGEGYFFAFGEAEKAGVMNLDKLSTHRKLRMMAKDFESKGQKLYIKGGTAREKLVSHYRPGWTRRSKDLDLLVVGDVKGPELYDTMEKYGVFTDIATAKDLPSFFRAADMSANQAVIAIPTGIGKRHKMIYTQGAAEDIKEGVLRYTDFSDPGRASQRISKFQSYYPGARVENAIPTRGDAFNQIEGFPEEGLNSIIRKTKGDHGSKWRGLWNSVSNLVSRYLTSEGRAMGMVSRNLASGVREGAGKLFDPRRAAQLANQSTSLEQFAEKLGTKAIIINTPEKEAWFSALKGKVSGLEGGAGYVAHPTDPFIVIHPEQVKESFKQMGLRSGVQQNVLDQALQDKNFMNTVLYHEVLEKGVAERFSQLNPMKSGHLGSQVLFGEGAFLSSLDSNQPLLSLFGSVRSKLKEAQPFFAGTKIPKIQDPINPIEGMQHKGMSQILRKIWTDFGSKYDLVRAMAKSAGQTFEEFTKSKNFLESLANAQIVKGLGKGSFGETFLMSGQLEGKEFQFVKKTFIKPTGKHLRRAADPAHEAFMLSEMGHTSMVPSLYGRTGENLFMEYMPGKMFHTIAGSGKNPYLKKAFVREIKEVMKIAASKDIKNLDIHGGNLLYDIKTKRYSWIDWGAAKQEISDPLLYTEMKRQLKIKTRNVGTEEHVRLLAFEGEMTGVGPSPETSGPKTIPSGPQSKRNISQKTNKVTASKQLLADQIQLADNAVNGGKRHTTYTTVRKG